LLGFQHQSIFWDLNWLNGLTLEGYITPFLQCPVLGTVPHIQLKVGYTPCVQFPLTLKPIAPDDISSANM